MQKWSVEAELYVGIRQRENELGSNRGSSAARQQMSWFLNKAEASLTAVWRALGNTFLVGSPRVSLSPTSLILARFHGFYPL